MPHKLPFRIVYASSQDDDYPAAELNYHAPTTKGWASCRFCTFPQRLVLELEEKCKITKIQILCHQSLIPSKVDFFIGGVVEGDRKSYEDADYILLGYVSLSDNKNTEFKARELKSVHIDTHGTFIQLVLHENYQNAHNIYNQVSLIAVNLIGEDSRSGSSLERGLAALRPEAVPTTEDLAFDIYQDPEVAKIIRRLEKQKLVAVTEERFDDAQKIRDATTYLQRVGERLGRLTMEKQQAVAEENYERAKLKKFQISEVRSNLQRDLDLVQMLDEDSPDCAYEKWNGSKGSPRTVALPATDSAIDDRMAYSINVRRHNTNGKDKSNSRNVSHTDPDERVLPALKNIARAGECEVRQGKDSNSNALIVSTEDGERIAADGPERARDVSDKLLATDVAVFQRNEPIPLDCDHRLLHNHHLHIHRSPVNTPPGQCCLGEEEHFLSKADSPPLPVCEVVPLDPPAMMDNPEPLSEANRRLASVAIDVVGVDLVTKALSKVWAFRESALMELQKRTTHPTLIPPVSTTGLVDTVDPRAELRSTTFLLKRALNDQVLSVFRLATELIKCAVVDFTERHGLPRADVFYAMDSLIPVLFSRTGETSLRLRDLAKTQILSMARWPQLELCSCLWSEFTRPFSSITLDRLALSRVELATELYAAHGVDAPTSSSTGDQHGFTLDALATFTAQALTHRLCEVREAAESLIVALYRSENRSIVRQVLPVDDIVTRRHPLYRRLFTKFDRIDGLDVVHGIETKGPRADLASAAKKHGDLNILHAEVERLRSMMNSAARSTPSPASRRPSKQPRGVLPCMRNRRQSVPARSPAPRPVTQKPGRKVPPVKPGGHEARGQVANGHGPPSAKSPRGNQETLVNQSEAVAGEAELLLSLDRTCIFCGEHNDKFNEEHLDLHYWKDCPMLYRCINCKQVVEIASMTDHLLVECEASPPGRFQRCPQCSEAISTDLLTSHSCLPCPENSIHCPLCHQDVLSVDSEGNTLLSFPSHTASGVEELWKAHLLGTGVPNVPFCTQNPRQKKPAQPKAKPINAGKSSPRASSEKAGQMRSFIPRPTHQPAVRPV